MTFAFSADGRLAYARPDGIGTVDIDKKYLASLLDITPLNTHSDWRAVAPSIAWETDNQTLYYETARTAAQPGRREDSPLFDISATSFESKATVSIAEGTGMFAYPSCFASAIKPLEKQYQVAYLQATFPNRARPTLSRRRDGSRWIEPANHFSCE